MVDRPRPTWKRKLFPSVSSCDDHHIGSEDGAARVCASNELLSVSDPAAAGKLGFNQIYMMERVINFVNFLYHEHTINLLTSLIVLITKRSQYKLKNLSAINHFYVPVAAHRQSQHHSSSSSISSESSVSKPLNSQKEVRFSLGIRSKGTRNKRFYRQSICYIA